MTRIKSILCSAFGILLTCAAIGLFATIGFTILGIFAVAALVCVNTGLLRLAYDHLRTQENRFSFSTSRDSA
ncbi:hypothetical protein J7413_19520 [Shimia sp. R10_1]|uniref:hypothetical protein n=1 Tax=Shimia sp. R10_1 TaxID=2821095 RepID=UPI001ADC7083|nr:hypothetical protein [Shimia sp. R10_1]MBO9475731.1 hypothetical protein [Shimia sp. R10_1]